MVIPVVIFFCIALVVSLSYISSSLFVVHQYQNEIDQKFLLDMDVLRCVRVLERSLWQHGDEYIERVYAAERGLYLYSLPNTHRCLFTLQSVHSDVVPEHNTIIEKKYVFKVALERLEGQGTQSSAVQNQGSQEPVLSQYIVHLVVETGDEFYIKHIFIKT